MDFLSRLPEYEAMIKVIREIVLTDIMLLGQTPCGSSKNDPRPNSRRAEVFLNRLSEAQVNECSTDSMGNPYAVIKGNASKNHPIMLVAHMDTTINTEAESHNSVSDEYLMGPGLLDNSLGAGVIMSLPHILKMLNVTFNEDIVLVGLTESLRESNLKSIRQVLSGWKSPIQAGICVEGGERGRLNYFSRGMIRAEIHCEIPKELGWRDTQGLNAMLTINEVINSILDIRLPLRPHTRIVLGKVQSGFKHGEIPLAGVLGFEIHSDSDKMVNETYEKVDAICGNIGHRNSAYILLKRISNVKAAKLTYHHPLVKAATKVMEVLDIQPVYESSESELSAFLNQSIPAITLGIVNGENYHQENAKMHIESMYKGIAQLIGVMLCIDRGVCHE